MIPVPINSKIMTRNYNRTYLFSFPELTDDQQRDVLSNYFDSETDAIEDQYVIHEFNDRRDAIPVSAFIRTGSGNNFTHGIHADSYFSGYYLTLSRCGQEAVIAYKHF